MPRIFLTNDEETDVAGDGAEVFGQAGDESVTLLDGYTGFLLDGNIEEVAFEGNYSDYTFEQQGINLNVMNGAGDLMATLAVQNDDNGTQLTFADRTVGATFEMTDQGPEIVIANNERDEAVNGNTAGAPLDASGADVTFGIEAGEYTQEIQNFESGDVLDFPDAVDPTLINPDFTDGEVGVQYAEGGEVAIIMLTGLDPADDAQLMGVSDLDTVFGEGTVI